MFFKCSYEITTKPFINLNLNISTFETLEIIFDRVFHLLEDVVAMFVMLSEGYETKLCTNINYFLEHYGVAVNTDCVVSSVYVGQPDPKRAIISEWCFEG
ncbi:MAG: hypothetical protein EZS28_049626 [Streblomastix strix]|uniref:IFT52 GIFT domain-containing protein n=1 Tax=Streblomastix strix TaxID=222440 RepID=A0A5J4T9G1_9EUKA|nr:MAG: hypothetical protein EZS28_049626 [Streblomastix strix]